MGLSTKVIDRLFTRLVATWGTSFMQQYRGTPETEIKTVWAHELDGYATRLDAIAWACDNLPEWPINAIVFRNLCRRAPVPDLPRLPEPQADPQRMADELAKLQPLIKAAKFSNVDHKAWAKRHLANHAAGVKVNQTALIMARAALGIDSTPRAEVMELA